jgi:hypothetical protein
MRCTLHRMLLPNKTSGRCADVLNTTLPHRYHSQAAGTSFEPPASVLPVFDLYILDGQQHFIAGQVGGEGWFYDLSTKGREITRAPDGNLEFPSAVIGQALNTTSFLNSARGAEYATFADRLLGKSVRGAAGDAAARTTPRGAIGASFHTNKIAPFVGSRHYYYSDYTVHLLTSSPPSRPLSLILTHAVSVRVHTHFLNSIFKRRVLSFIAHDVAGASSRRIFTFTEDGFNPNVQQ